MNYGSLRRRDLEISTGLVEGAIEHVIGRRQDHGGMRWEKGRAEALLELRCIEVVGDWDLFERHVHDRMHVAGRLLGRTAPLQAKAPSPLPRVGKAA